MAAVALAGTAALVLIAIPLMLPTGQGTPVAAAVVATVDRVEGLVEALADRAGPGDARTLVSDAPVHADEWVTTGATGRAALRVTNGASVRLDVGSRARLSTAMVIELTEGALYVDTGSEVTGLEVRTPLGTARDVGTQFEIRMHESALRVRVRTGVVEVWRDDRPITAHPGTELTVTDHDVVSGTVSSFGPEWGWVVGIAPEIQIDGRPLAASLEAISREHGWRVRYADAALAVEAAAIVLHGSVAGLAPLEVVSVAVTTSGLEHRLQDGEIVVSRVRPDAAPEEEP
jgi:ferric-dicitrate binding protein FerR (iron transport regulator)